MDLTQEIILQHGRTSPYRGRMKDPTLSTELDNPLCGDTVKIDIKIAKGEIEDICFSGEGCLISQASASLMVGEAKRVKDLSKIRKFNEKTVFNLLGIPLTPSRIQCATLALEVLRKAFKTSGFPKAGYLRPEY